MLLLHSKLFNKIIFVSKHHSPGREFLVNRSLWFENRCLNHTSQPKVILQMECSAFLSTQLINYSSCLGYKILLQQEDPKNRQTSITWNSINSLRFKCM